ncbi:MAG: putative quinol monooxygenase [Pseudomonadota bacterium]
MGFCVSVKFEVRNEHLEEFRAAMIQQANASLEELGCSRFDVWSDEANPTVIYLYEVYNDRDAFDVHLASAHFASFDAEIADWVIGKRVETFGMSLGED